MKSTLKKTPLLTGIILLYIFISSCDLFTPPSEIKESKNSTPNENNLWTWMEGSNLVNQSSVYGIKGTPDINNCPSGRSESICWTDIDGNFWLFGGWEYKAPATVNYLNDLWKFDGANWTWISGSNTGNQSGIYGTKGVSDSANVPGARTQGVSWIDKSDNLWLFGGSGYDINGDIGSLNDLWKFDGANWTWISGSNIKGTSGVTYDTTIPGACVNSVSWIDDAGTLWLFGGYGNDCLGNNGYMNDLWKFDGTNWTFVKGNHATNPLANYGDKNVTVSSNIPGGRISSITWVDKNNSLCLFGGTGYDDDNNYGFLNDLWKFDGTNWTWISGSNIRNQKGIYGIKGSSDNANVPGARNGSISWMDSLGNFWLFGGLGADITGSTDYINDLWKFDGINWTWVSGNNVIRATGDYGVKGIPSASNIPGARNGSISWIDKNGNLWLFGGFGYGSTGTAYYLNDLWKYKP